MSVYNIFIFSFELLTTVYAVIQAELATALWGYTCHLPDSRRLSRTFPPFLKIIFLYEMLLLMATYISCSSES